MGGDASGVGTWTDQVSAFDRVRSVAETLSQPRPASYIADEAHVAETTARTHLDCLVDLGILLESNHGGITMYSPDPLYTRMQTVRDLLDEHDRDELIRRKSRLQDQIETWRDEFEVESLDALREQAAKADDAAERRNILETVSDWELVDYRLGIVEEVIENYPMYSRNHQSSI